LSARWLKSILVRSAELVLAVGFVLFFFLAFWFILGMSFPTGPTLADLIAEANLTRLPMWTGISPAEGPEESGEPLIASLSYVRRTVKDKPSSAIAWREARPGTALEDRHAVQTFDHSGATITFSEGSELNLAENSLVVLKSLEGFAGAGVRRASLIVLDGQLRGQIVVPGEKGMAVEIVAVTDAARMEVRTAPGQRAEFSVAVSENGSSIFSVYSGTAEVTSGSSSRILPENRSVTVSSAGEPNALEVLPAAPALRAPPDGAVFSFRSVPPRVRFAWAAEQQPAGVYRFVLARDPGFRRIVHEARLSEPQFTHGNLAAGDYYWRVSVLRGAVEGAMSRTGHLKMAEDREPPQLTVRFPAGVVRSDRVVLAGQAEPGSTVYVGDAKVPTGASGEFRCDVKLERGLNVVVVEAVDAAGNVTYRSQLVNAQF